MKQTIQKACDVVGGQTALAKILTSLTGDEVTQQRVYNWVSRGDEVPIHLMAAIETATSGEVTRRDFRPKDWKVIWPELSEEQNRRSTDPKG